MDELSSQSVNMEFLKDMNVVLPGLTLPENSKFKEFLCEKLLPHPPLLFGKFGDFLSSECIDLLSRFLELNSKCHSFHRSQDFSIVSNVVYEMNQVCRDLLDVGNKADFLESKQLTADVIDERIVENNTHVEKMQKSVEKKEKRIRKIESEIRALEQEKEILLKEINQSNTKISLKQSIAKVDTAHIFPLPELYVTSVKVCMSNHIVSSIDYLISAVIKSLDYTSQCLVSTSEKYMKMKLVINEASSLLDASAFSRFTQLIAAHSSDISYLYVSLNTFLDNLDSSVFAAETLLSRYSYFKSTLVDKVVSLRKLCENYGPLFDSNLSCSSKLAIFHSNAYLEHCTGSHPECANRIRVVMEGLYNAFGETQTVEFIEASHLATKAELSLAHSPDYVEHMLRLLKSMPGAIEYFNSCKDPKFSSMCTDPFLLKMMQRIRFDTMPIYMYDCDTAISVGSHRAALLAAGSVIEAVESVMNSRSVNAFCVVRPPGHHAGTSGVTPGAPSSGFCLFNNVAVGALYSKLRVVIFDFDVHHGNGTQQICSNREGVAFISTHVVGNGFYPRTGYQSGDADNILNIPLRMDFTPKQYMEKFYSLIVPFIKKFRPDVIMISAGFDARHGELMLSPPAPPMPEPTESMETIDLLTLSENMESDVRNSRENVAANIEISESTLQDILDAPTKRDSIVEMEVVREIAEKFGKRKIDEVVTEDADNSKVAKTAHGTATDLTSEFYGMADDSDDDDDEDFTEKDFLEEEVSSDDSQGDNVPKEFTKDVAEFEGLLASDYYNISFELGQLARQFCHGRIVSVLEGGYGETRMSECVINHLKGIQDGSSSMLRKIN